MWALKALSQVPSKCLHELLRQRFKMSLHQFVLWHSLRQQHPVLSHTISTQVWVALAAGDQGTSVHPHLTYPLQSLAHLLAPQLTFVGLTLFPYAPFWLTIASSPSWHTSNPWLKLGLREKEKSSRHMSDTNCLMFLKALKLFPT